LDGKAITEYPAAAVRPPHLQLLGAFTRVLGEQKPVHNTFGNQYIENLFLLQATTNIMSFS
jgi:hypothetical protein